MNSNSLLLPILKFSKKNKRLVYSIVFISVFCFTVLFSILYSKAIVSENYAYNNYGIHHGEIYDLDIEQLNSLKTNNSIIKYGIKQDVASLDTHFRWGDYDVKLSYADNNYLNLRGYKLKLGKWPKSSNEIAMSETVLNNLGITKILNQELKLKVILNNNTTVTKEFKLVGIFKDQLLNNKQFVNDAYMSLKAVISDLFIEGNRSILSINKYTVALINKDTTFETMSSIVNELNAVQYSRNNQLYYESLFQRAMTNYFGDSLLSNYIVLFFLVLVITVVSIILIIQLHFQQNSDKLKILHSVGTTSKQVASVTKKSTLPFIALLSVVASIVGLIVSKVMNISFKSLLLGESINYQPYLMLAIIVITINLIYSFTIHIAADVLNGRYYTSSFNKIINKSKSKILKSSKKEKSKFSLFYCLREMKVHKHKSFLLIMFIVIVMFSFTNIAMLIKEHSINNSFNKINYISITSKHISSSYSILDKDIYLDNNIEFSSEVVNEINDIPELENVKTYKNVYGLNYSAAIPTPKKNKYMINNIINYDRYNYKKYKDTYDDLYKLGLDENLFFFGRYRSTVDIDTLNSISLSNLNSLIDEGSINLDALKKGEEIVLCLGPMQTYRYLDGGYSNRVVKKMKNKSNYYQDDSLKVGDYISLVRVVPIDNKNHGTNWNNELKNLKLEYKKVRIGAIIKKAGYYKLPNGDEIAILSSPYILTHTEAEELTVPKDTYQRLDIYLKEGADIIKIAAKVTQILQRRGYYKNTDYYLKSSLIENSARKSMLFTRAIKYLSFILITTLFSYILIKIFISSNYGLKKKQLSLLRAIGLENANINSILKYQAFIYSCIAGVLSSLISIIYIYKYYMDNNFVLRQYEWYNLVPYGVMIALIVISSMTIYYLDKKQYKRVLNENIAHTIKHIE